MASYAQIANDLAAWRLKLVGTGNDKLCGSLRRAESTIRELETKLDRWEESVFVLQERDRIISKMEDEKLALQLTIAKLHRDLDDYRLQNEQLRRR